MDIFTAFGLSASAGLNAYIPLLAIALLARFTNLIKLNSPWNTLTDWWVIGVLVLLLAIEFFADKVPAINHINDIIQTFVRPAAGAVLFAASAKVITDVSPVLSMVLGLVVAGSVHTVKAAAVRPMVTATTGGTGNVPISILEDVISTFLSIISVIIPVLVAAVVVIIAAWVILRIGRRPDRTRRGT
jgi:hypothetical protein